MPIETDISKITDIFPIFKTYPDLLYLDSASTTHKPISVIQAEKDFYTRFNANILRGNYPLAIQATELIEQVRERVRDFIGAKSLTEIIFTRGTTDGLNLLAQSLWKKYYKRRPDQSKNIVVSILEHHANFLPWQWLTKELGWELRIVGYNADYELDLLDLETKLDEHTEVLALTHSSNVFGGVLDTDRLLRIFEKLGRPKFFVLDAAQSVAHRPLNVEKLGVDFLVFSGHKMYGPTGVGVLYGRQEYLSDLPPVQLGGEMIDWVTIDGFGVASLPNKFEAGTLPLAQIVALGKAVEFLESFKQKNGLEYSFARSELEASQRLLTDLAKVSNIKIYLAPKSTVVSTSLPGISSYDLGVYLGLKGVAVRSGKHCAHPLINRLSSDGLLRFSLGIYNLNTDFNISHQIQRFLELAR